MAEHHDTTEEYLQTILQIEEEGERPMRAHLVKRLGLAAPSVSETVRRLVDRGLVAMEPDRSLRLTETGRRIAVSTVRRHRLAERLLADVIGLEWEKVHREAGRWEHVISADVEDKLVALLGDPDTCPHGNPIPGAKRRPGSRSRRSAVPLSQARPGPVTVTRLDEELEHDDAALALLARSDLIPTRQATVVETGSSTVTVMTDSGEHAIDGAVARHLWVVAS